jgi:hypothetical protein
MLRLNQAPAGRSKKVGTQDESSMQHSEAAAVPCNATRPNIAVLHGWGWAANLYDTTAVYIRASVVLCLTTYRVWVHIPYSTFVMNSLHLPRQVLASPDLLAARAAAAASLRAATAAAGSWEDSLAHSGVTTKLQGGDSTSSRGNRCTLCVGGLVGFSC